MLFLIVAISTLPYSLAFPGYHYGINKLQSVPDEESYRKIQYPHFDIIEFGDYRKNHLPPKIIHEIKKIIIQEPKPYPVKVPHPYPYPVIQKVPVHVVNQEIVKVPEPVPYPVIQTVSVPFEVPKPYPVPIDEFKETSPNVGEDHISSDSSYTNQIDPGSLNQEQEQTCCQPLDLEQYGKLNGLINQSGNKEDSNQQGSDDRPVYEDQKEDVAN